MEDDYPTVIMDSASGGTLYTIVRLSVSYDKLQIIRASKAMPFTFFTGKQ